MGVPGNEKADQEAKAAVHNGEVLNPEIQYKEYTSLTRKFIRDKWTKEWEESNNKLKLHKEHIGPIFKTGRSRREEVIIRRLRLGHTEETHGYLLNKTNPPVCERCNVPKTVHHLLYCCELSCFRREEATLGRLRAEVYFEKILKWKTARRIVI